MQRTPLEQFIVGKPNSAGTFDPLSDWFQCEPDALRALSQIQAQHPAATVWTSTRLRKERPSGEPDRAFRPLSEGEQFEFQGIEDTNVARIANVIVEGRWVSIITEPSTCQVHDFSDGDYRAWVTRPGEDAPQLGEQLLASATSEAGLTTAELDRLLDRIS